MTSWRDKYSVHPAADVFPMMSDEELKMLGEDIRANGLKGRITFWRDQVIDGRNRLAAMHLARIPVRAEHTTGINCNADPVAHIISLNIHRRHLTKQQIADLIVADCLREYLASLGEVLEAERQAEEKALDEWWDAKIEENRTKRAARDAARIAKGEAKRAAAAARAASARGGRGKIDALKAAAVAKAAEHSVSKRTVERSFAAHEQASDHPNAPGYERRAKAAKKRAQKREDDRQRAIAAATPKTVDDCRRLYLDAVRRLCADPIAEHELLWEAFQAMLREREQEGGS
jgi:hypothetical protein